MSRSRAFRVLGVASVLFMLLAGRGHAQVERAGEVDGYRVQRWGVNEGLPVNHVTSLAQTPDGYLWIGTWDGLVRFDGFDFDIYNVGNTPALPSNRVQHMKVGPDGALWVVYEDQSLVRYREGVFEDYSKRFGFEARNVYFTGGGNLDSFV